MLVKSKSVFSLSSSAGMQSVCTLQTEPHYAISSHYILTINMHKLLFICDQQMNLQSQYGAKRLKVRVENLLSGDRM